jgi:exosome complex RNA-binding protein Rrp4
VAIGTNGYIYTRQEDQKWTLVDQSMKMSAVTQLKDGRVIGLDQNGNYFSK